MNQFTIHITGTMDNDDGGMDVIDITDTGAHLFTICGTTTQTKDGENITGSAHMMGEWGMTELTEMLYRIMKAIDNPKLFSLAMMYAIKMVKEEMEQGAPAEAQP